MKKFIILLMSIVLLFSVFAMSACDSGDTGEVNSSSETSSEEESSSPGKVSRNFGGGSSNADIETSGGNGFIPTTSSGGNGTTSVPEVSFSGDSFYAPETVAPEGTSPKAAMLIMQISFIEVTPSNYEMAEATIKDAEDFYNTLTASEKAEVINYNDLVAAREAFNKIKAAGVWAKFEQGVNALPAPEALKNANVDAVYAMKDLMDENKASLSQNAGFTALEATLNACYTKVQSSLIEKTYISQDLNGDSFISPDEDNKNDNREGNSDFFTRTGSGGAQASKILYTDVKNPNPVSLIRIFKGDISFNAPCAGTLTAYVQYESSKPYNVTLDGELIHSEGQAQPIVVKIPKAGKVVIQRSDAANKARFYAVKFSYPNLG